MDREKVESLPINGDMSSEEFRRLAHGMVDWTADYLAGIVDLPVLPNSSVGDLEEKLGRSPTVQGEEMEEILEDIDRLIMPAMTHWNHPANFAWFNSSGSGAGILGEMLTAVFNVNAMLWKACPAATELEKVTLRWLRGLLGLPDELWGIMYEGGSSSNFHALAAARQHLAGLRLREDGLAGRRDLSPLSMYISDQTHSSMAKAAIALGIGLSGVRTISTDDTLAMSPDKLAAAIDEDRRSGRQPFCVVATVGTTSSGSIDPLKEIGVLCREEGLWFHVDASYGGAVAVVPEKRRLLDGWQDADSIVINPHKWLFVPIDLSVLFTRQPEVLRAAFSLSADYLQTGHDELVDNYNDYGISLGRRFRALKLWFVLRYFGADGLAGRIRTHLDLARLLADWIDHHPDFERTAHLSLSVVCFRAHPAGIDDEGNLEQLNSRLLKEVNSGGAMFMTSTRLHGRFTLRMVISHLKTRETNLRQGWQVIQNVLKEILEQE